MSNLRQIEDRMRDVDPDLRYMALEDLQKHVVAGKAQPPVSAALARLVLTLLQDPVSEVQHQAVRTIPLLVRAFPNDDAVQLVAQLYAEVGRVAGQLKFSTAVPTLALRGVFRDAHTRMPPLLGRALCTALVPLLLAAPLTIDTVEIAIDMAHACGATLTDAELCELAVWLARHAFAERGVLATRCVAAVEACVACLGPGSGGFLDSALAAALGHATDARRRRVFFSLAAVYLGRAGPPHCLSPESLGTVFGHISVLAAPDTLYSGDWDDVLAQNAERELALATMAAWVPCVDADSWTHTFAAPVVLLLQVFLRYRPQTAPLLDEDLGSEPDFSDSDIEQVDESAESATAAARLRVQALLVVKQLVTSLPQATPLLTAEKVADLVVDAVADSSDAVSAEAVVALSLLIRHLEPARARAGSDASMATESAPLLLPAAFVARIEDVLFSEVLVAQHVHRFASAKALVELLISNARPLLSKNFLGRLHGQIAALSLGLATYPELVSLYSAILTCFPLGDIPSPLLDYICHDLGQTLAGFSYTGLTLDVLAASDILFEKAGLRYAPQINSVFLTAIQEKASSSQYSSDLRQSLVSTLTVLLVNVDLEQRNVAVSRGIFRKALDFEVTVNFILELMATVCAAKPEIMASPDFADYATRKVTSYLRSSDSSLYHCLLVFLVALFEHTDYRAAAETASTLKTALCNLVRDTTDLALLDKCFTALSYTLESSGADADLAQFILTQILNKDLAEDRQHMKLLEALLGNVVRFSALTPQDLFQMGQALLAPENFVSAQILAFVAATYSLHNEIHQVEAQINQTEPSAQVFGIHFLGCVAAQGLLTSIGFDGFCQIMNSSDNEQICLAAARALGLCIKRDVAKHLPTLLELYASYSAENDNRCYYALVAIKEALSLGVDVESQAAGHVWQAILDVVGQKPGEFLHKDVPELKLAGDILGDIAVGDVESTLHLHKHSHVVLEILNRNSEACNERLVYTIVVLIKQLACTDVEVVGTQIIEGMLRFLTRPNLDLKLAIISTLLTGMYNKASLFAEIAEAVILPQIYDELAAKDEFKKVIPMGPYKYVVDEGLEVRKLSYELINTILSTAAESGWRINEVHVFEVMLQKGLKDAENDIINLSVTNLMQILRHNEKVLFSVDHAGLIQLLAKVTSRKLRSKASTQEMEGYEDTMRAVIKLARHINAIFVANNTVSAEWGEFFLELRNKHHLLFGSSEP